MEKQLFAPKTMNLPGSLLLVPQFWDKDYYNRLKQRASGVINLVLSELLLFENYTAVVGFLGYPHILTILQFIEGVKDKEIYFLGTAGTMNEAYNQPRPLLVEEIFSTELLDHFAPETSYGMKTFDTPVLPRVKGVTVDIIQRETAPWLREQVKRGMDFVEMEIFPLRAYLEKPFTALVVTSDLLKETGIEVFPNKKELARQFVATYELIENMIDR